MKKFIQYTFLIFCLSECNYFKNNQDQDNNTTTKNLSDFKSPQQSSIEKKISIFEAQYSEAVNDIGKLSTEKQFEQWVNNYYKDSLSKISQWACKISDIKATPEVATIQFGAPTNEIKFRGILTAIDTLYKSLENIPKDTYVIISGRNTGIAYITKETNNYLGSFTFDIILDSIKTIPNKIYESGND